MMSTVTPLLPTQPPRTRTRTPPAIKWLLNERAALAGAQQSTQDAIPRLQHQVELALANLARAEHELAVAERALELGSKKLQALDSTLAQVNSAVDPHAGGVIKAWQGKYGERGALTKLLLELLQSAAPSPMALHQIVDHVELHFGIQHPEPKSRQRLRFSIRTCLRQLQTKTGEVEPFRPTQSHPPGYWVYKELASMDKLRELADKVNEQEASWP
ncbi:hypothetical protein [[Acidovorax] ebreus]|uniref:hypothetical protein n=1 Tax=Diaphorobacter sp. LI3 TaxID=2952886 RepID=UPI00206802FA|nr:hypothetical protein MRB47_17290 [Diaphorobacter sp. LI3]